MKVSAAQAAALLGISERTMRRRIVQGSVSARKIAPNRYEIELEEDALEYRKSKLTELSACMDRLEALLMRLEFLLNESNLP